VRGDVLNSLRANAVGTLLALFWMAMIPWCLASCWLRRSLLVRSMERAFAVVVLSFLGLLLLRWVVVLGLAVWLGRPSWG
jgi:hypothetical protein